MCCQDNYLPTKGLILDCNQGQTLSVVCDTEHPLSKNIISINKSYPSLKGGALKLAIVGSDLLRSSSESMKTSRLEQRQEYS